MARPMPLEDDTWQEDALDWIEAKALDGREFSADDLAAEFRSPPHPNSVGPVFNIAQRRGRIEPVGYRASSHKTRRGGALRIWQGTPQVIRRRQEIAA